MRNIHAYKSTYNCKSVIYFNLGSDILTENCNFLKYYFTKTYIRSTVLDGRNEIILAIWPDDKHNVQCK